MVLLKLTAFLVLSAAVSSYSWQINWFHLQDFSGSWKGHMQDMTDQLTTLANTIEEHYPGSHMGSAGYSDKALKGEDYVLISNLTEKSIAINRLLTKYPSTWFPQLPPGKGPWPSDDSNYPQAQYVKRQGKADDEPEGCLEPIIWASLHTNWDKGPNVLRLITQAIAGLGHYNGDGSAEELAARRFADFTRDTYPSAEASFRPQTGNIKLGNAAKYADVSLTKAVLEEQNVKLVILYGIDGNNETPRDGWRKLLTEMGVDYHTSLYYMPAELNVAENIISHLVDITDPTTTTTTTTPTTTTTKPTTTTPTTTTTKTTTTTPTATTTPTITSTEPKSVSATTAGTGDCVGDCGCHAVGCWKGRGILLAVDARPKDLELKLTQ